LCCSIGAAQTVSADLVAKTHDLLAHQRWQEVVTLVESTPARSVEIDYVYGTALAHLGRLPEARRAFEAGGELAPRDARFPEELAGVEFKQKHYKEASELLRHALDIAPDDAYANDFLGTVYFLQRNLEAALKYWNRVNKPEVATVIPEPAVKTDPALLDRTFAFAPASVFKFDELALSRERLSTLGVFSSYGLNLVPRDDGKFDVLFRNDELNGLGNSKLAMLVNLLRGLPAEEVDPEYFNFHHEAINFEGFYRWDEQKRRWAGSVSGPWRGDPNRRYWSGFDVRNENWNIRTAFRGPAAELGSFNMRREAAGASFLSIVNGRWTWSAAGEVSHRDFRSVIPGPAITPSLLAEGFQLKEMTQVKVDLWRLPERRMDLTGGASSEVGRIWSEPSHSFFKMQGTTRFRWLPGDEADGYEVQERLLSGKTLGEVPVDELFILGVLGDNGLQMRGHVTTRQGRKGSGPMGREYFVSNSDFDKTLFDKWGLQVKAGPFLDVGTINDANPALGSHEWLYDVGLKVRGSLFGMGAVFIYGKDLRSGSNAFTVGLE
jgi:hypothetical protein